MYDEETPNGWRMPAESDAEPATTVTDAVRSCRRLADTMGADQFGLFFLASQGEGRRLVPVFDGEFPGVSLLSRTLSALTSESLARRLAEATRPAWWRPAKQAPFLTEDARSWATEIAEPVHDMSAIAFPVALERVRSGAIVFAGNGMALDEDALCDAHARCYALFADVARMRMPDCVKAPTVSKREIECLRLTAGGLTSDSIAVALGLSVHTANQYLTNSTHKLNAVNRIHAVAKALRSGLID